MPADEVTHGADVEASRVRSGPRHAAPKKPLFTRFHVPAGKAIALAAMPTAVLMGMGFTPTLALADDHPTSKSLTADEYKACMAALEDGASASASPSPSASDESKDPSADASKDDSSGSSDKGDGTADPKPSASPDGSGSSDSGSDDKADPTPTPTAGGSASTGKDSDATASPSPSETDKNLLDDIGDAVTGIFTGGSKATESGSPTPSATPSASQSPTAGSGGSASTGKGTSDALKDTTKKVTDTVDGTVKGATDTASKAAEDATKAVEKAAQDAKDAAGKATSSPSPSAGASTAPEDCPAATEADGAVDNDVLLPDDPWYLDASKLTLNGADYKGVVEVRTASGKVKKVLKYVISDGTEIVDLHQTVKDKRSGNTYHVQAAKGSTSKIENGKTVMYTESISGNLLGLIPLTFTPDNPPPLNIPLIIFTNVKVVQAGQFGGTLTIPGMRQYITD
ncbi:hypothetical protein [Streptomyces sp. NPDC050287]|uniref:hypothetical protein n=1 Tax=Streptomyces sp. NPDC050287 TaxID=3365608 RepID=UPI00379CABF4